MNTPHCALCGTHGRRGRRVSLETTWLPGGYRCTNRTACRKRLRALINAHLGLAKACQ